MAWSRRISLSRCRWGLGLASRHTRRLVGHTDASEQGHEQGKTAEEGVRVGCEVGHSEHVAGASFGLPIGQEPPGILGVPMACCRCGAGWVEYVGEFADDVEQPNARHGPGVRFKNAGLVRRAVIVPGGRA